MDAEAVAVYALHNLAVLARVLVVAHALADVLAARPAVVAVGRCARLEATVCAVESFGARAFSQ